MKDVTMKIKTGRSIIVYKTLRLFKKEHKHFRTSIKVNIIIKNIQEETFKKAIQEKQLKKKYSRKIFKTNERLFSLHLRKLVLKAKGFIIQDKVIYYSR